MLCPDGRRRGQTRAGMKLYNKRVKHVTAPYMALFLCQKTGGEKMRLSEIMEISMDAISGYYSMCNV